MDAARFLKIAMFSLEGDRNRSRHLKHLLVDTKHRKTNTEFYNGAKAIQRTTQPF